MKNFRQNDRKFGISEEYTTLIKQPRCGNLSKSLPIVHMKILSTDSDFSTQTLVLLHALNC